MMSPVRVNFIHFVQRTHYNGHFTCIPARKSDLVGIFVRRITTQPHFNLGESPVMVDCHHRNHGNEGKYGTIQAMTSASPVVKATKVTMVTKINNHTSLFDPVACGARVDPTSQVPRPIFFFFFADGRKFKSTDLE
jgi:hypothetical protein